MKPRATFQNLPPFEYGSITAPDGEELLQLSKNESMHGVAPGVADYLRQNVLNPSLYPDHDFTRLRHTIAQTHGLDPDRVWCGAGSTTLLYFLATLYLEAGRSAVSSQYGYQYFQMATKLNDGQANIALESDLTVSVDNILAAVRPDTSMVFLANPGNPTGTYLLRPEIERLRDNLPNDVLLLLDEAYSEYVDEERYSANFDLADRGNTAIVRTFSKVYGMAGMRVGWGYFPAETMQLIRQVKIPNAVSSLSTAAAEIAMVDQAHVARVRAFNRVAREQFTDQLEELGLAPIRSQTSFVLCKFASPTEAKDCLAYLRAEGIVVRPMGMYDLHDHLRFSIGTSEQMDRVAHALAAWRSQ